MKSLRCRRPRRQQQQQLPACTVCNSTHVSQCVWSTVSENFTPIVTLSRWTPELKNPLSSPPTDTHTHTLTHLCLSVSVVQRTGFLSLCLWEGRQLCKVTVWLCHSTGTLEATASKVLLQDCVLPEFHAHIQAKLAGLIRILSVLKVSVAERMDGPGSPFALTLLLPSVLLKLSSGDPWRDHLSGVPLVESRGVSCTASFWFHSSRQGRQRDSNWDFFF